MDKMPSLENEKDDNQKEVDRKFMNMPDGTVADITEMTPEEIQDLKEDARSALK